MNIFEDTNPRALKDRLGEIHTRTSVLPDFQRDFVWEPGATQELIISIANNYPAGSILRVRDAKRVFACREFEGAPKLDGRRHTFLVLDGQQRLTSLYQAFYGVGEHRYYLDLRKLLDCADFEEAIFHMRATTKWAKAREGFDLQAKELLLPLSVLKGGAGGFLQWLLQITNPMPQEERTRMLDALTKINEQWIKTIDDYHFPVVTLSDQTEPDALCTIFETLNRTLIDRTTNQIISARAPSQYLAEIRNTPGFPFEVVLASHCLPTGDNRRSDRRLDLPSGEDRLCSIDDDRRAEAIRGIVEVHDCCCRETPAFDAREDEHLECKDTRHFHFETLAILRRLANKGGERYPTISCHEVVGSQALISRTRLNDFNAASVDVEEMQYPDGHLVRFCPIPCLRRRRVLDARWSGSRADDAGCAPTHFCRGWPRFLG